jgi:hypothetical protein
MFPNAFEVNAQKAKNVRNAQTIKINHNLELIKDTENRSYSNNCAKYEDNSNLEIVNINKEMKNTMNFLIVKLKPMRFYLIFLKNDLKQ